MRATRLGLAALVLAGGAWAAAPPGPPGRLLVLTHSAGYEHEVVRRPAPGRPALAEQVIAELGRESGAFTVTLRQTAAELEALTPTAVRAHGGVLLFTTGSLPLTPEAREALFARVREGGGLVGVHSASDTWYEVPEYGALLGGVFDGHPWHEPVRILVEDPAHPATAHLGAAFALTDEIYQFRSWARGDLRVLLRLDPASVDLGRGKRRDGDYALAWTRPYGAGRVFYTALGHRPEVWRDARFRRHLLGGILWALGAR
jgi:type 1 glutamine amidotransferase